MKEQGSQQLFSQEKNPTDKKFQNRWKSQTFVQSYEK
jgi:hypothetical protein